MSGTENTPRQPASNAQGKARDASRRARLANALRDNLRKRKAQIRDREGGDGAADGPTNGPDRK